MTNRQDSATPPDRATDPSQEPKTLGWVPVQGRVLAQRQAAATHQNGIEIPSRSQRPPNEAVVVAVDPFHPSFSVNMLLIVGDIIYVADYAGTTLNLDGQTYMVYRPEEILAVRHDDARVERIREKNERDVEEYHRRRDSFPSLMTMELAAVDAAPPDFAATLLPFAPPRRPRS